MCPFKIRYKFNAETESHQLFDFDDMHNHQLICNPQVIPFPSRYRSIAKFETPNFELNFRKVIAESNSTGLRNQLSKLTQAEYNFPIYVQTTYNNKNGVNLFCGFKAWSNTEVELMETMQSGDRGAIQNLVNHRVGVKFTCPFRLHY